MSWVISSPRATHCRAKSSPVVGGATRAIQTTRQGPRAIVDPSAAVPIVLHGDAAFPGQGVVAETLNLARLPGYDVIHCNDWQCGLIPAYLQIEYAHTRGYESMGSLFTIHNMAYQGVFWHWDMLLTGLDWKYFNWHQMEFYGKLNLLKTGIVFADWLTTVSPTYAKEIQTEEFGCGLEGALRQRSEEALGRIVVPVTDGEEAAFAIASRAAAEGVPVTEIQRRTGAPRIDGS